MVEVWSREYCIFLNNFETEARRRIPSAKTRPCNSCPQMACRSFEVVPSNKVKAVITLTVSAANPMTPSAPQHEPQHNNPSTLTSIRHHIIQAETLLTMERWRIPALVIFILALFCMAFAIVNGTIGIASLVPKNRTKPTMTLIRPRPWQTEDRTKILRRA